MTTMDSRYRIVDTSEIISPALIVFRDLVEQNIDEMVRIARDPQRLRPHDHGLGRLDGDLYR